MKRWWRATSYLIDKFKGQYRLKPSLDIRKNDFTRKLNGSLEDSDVYISCQYNNKIFHVGKDVLQAYIPSKTRGHNIIKTIEQIDPSIIFNIEETDSEVFFQFKYINSDKIIPLLKPRTSGACISPFSTKNLKKTDYNIPDEDFNRYKSIVSKIPKESILTITHSTNAFIKTLETKQNSMENIKADMRKKGLKAKEYIHYIGRWEEYLSFLTKELSNH